MSEDFPSKKSINPWQAYIGLIQLDKDYCEKSKTYNN